MTSPENALRMLHGLLRAGHPADIERLPGLVAEHAAGAGLEQVRIHLADLRHPHQRCCGS